MKKMYKQFLALLLTFAMLMSNMTIAFARESINLEDEYQNSVRLYTIERTQNYYANSGENLSDGQTESGSCYTSVAGKVRCEFVIIGSAKLKLQVKYRLSGWQTMYDANVTNDSIVITSGGELPAGTQVKYTVTSNGRTNSYGIIIGRG